MITLLGVILAATGVFSAQQLQLSDSYLPVVMQVIAHITDQMAFEVQNENTLSTSKPSTTTKPTVVTQAPPYVTGYPGSQSTNGWWSFLTTKRPDLTTPYHKPGLYAPAVPPKPSYRSNDYNHKYVLLPVEQNSQYTVIGPQEIKTEGPLLSIQHEEVSPLMEPTPQTPHLLPPHFEQKVVRQSSSLQDPDEENLQYLSENVRELIKMARNPDDHRLVDVWDETRSGPKPTATKASFSTTNLRLLLLYDLLNREAKTQKLSDYHGFSPKVMKELVDSSRGSVREQLRMALSRMVERNDSGHTYANNRAKEMVEELGKDESKFSSELRYLQPLIYTF